MVIDKRSQKMIDSLKYVIDGKLGKYVEKEGQYITTIEAYPYENGVLVLNCIEDTRKYIFEYRKLMFYVTRDCEFDIIGECDIENGESAIDTCITPEFIVTKKKFEKLQIGANSGLFKKKNKLKLQQQIDYCTSISKRAIEKLLKKFEV